MLYVMSYKQRALSLKYIHVYMLYTSGEVRKPSGVCSATTVNAFLLCSFSHYIFLRPEDGPQWPKYVVSLIKDTKAVVF